jgi:hypothetical protein
MKIAFPTDEHRPFQDDRAVHVALKIVSDFNPDVLILGSDGMDFYNISKFNKNPERVKTGLQDEIDQWQAGVRDWSSAAPSARKLYLIGNHEERWRTWLWYHPEIHDLNALKYENLLELAKLGIEWDPRPSGNLEHTFFNRLVIRHGRFVRKWSGMSAKAELEADRYSISSISGHTHRGGSHYATTRNGMVQAHEAFCLCRLDPEYILHPDWQQGIVLAEVDVGNLSVETIPIINDVLTKKAIWRGKEYISR